VFIYNMVPITHLQPSNILSSARTLTKSDESQTTDDHNAQSTTRILIAQFNIDAYGEQISRLAPAALECIDQ